VAIVPRDVADAIVVDARSASSLTDETANGTIPALVLVDDPQAEAARTALRHGAAGVLARGAPADEIVAALAAIGAGLLVLDGSAREIVAPAAAPPRRSGAGELTQREREVLAMLAAGHPNRGIAERLAISENTVKAHVAAIFGKLGATTRTEAVTIALRRGLVML
jgi:DNA-binding NarL/FixJ family response regulator